MPYFGWRTSLFGPPTCFKSEEQPRSNTPLTKDDYNWPHNLVRKISDEEYKLPLDTLREKYPYVEPKEGT